MLVLRRVMNSTYFFALRDCCCGAVVAVEGAAAVVIAGGVTAGLDWAVEFVWLGGLAVASPAEADGAGVACGEVLVGGAAC